MRQVSGMNQEVRRLWQRIDLVDGNPQSGVHIGVGGFVESNPAVTDLHELKSLLHIRLTQQL